MYLAALWPTAIKLWTYISGKPLQPMLQLRITYTRSCSTYVEQLLLNMYTVCTYTDRNSCSCTIRKYNWIVTSLI